ncbi:MAG: hypothetical protein JXR76_31900 [Deltaproteobacteria bacterium]|nr:hypothetical protein [Deltaproteobacteria bacterium]
MNKFTPLMITLIFPTFIACARGTSITSPPHHGAFFRTNWQPLHQDSNSKATSVRNSTRDKKNAGLVASRREAIVRESLKLYHSGKSAKHYGAPDVYSVFQSAGLTGCIAASDDAPDIVKKATRANAYFTREKPQSGDIVLFHNQYDRNRNGKSDDWFTGAAIIIEAGRRTHTAVTRTSGVPRLIRISPRGPMVREFRGKSVNSYVKIPDAHDPTDAQYLSGQLYAGFVDIDAFLRTCSRQADEFHSVQE